MATLEPHKDDKQVLAESRARSEYGLDTLANVPVARYNSYMGNSYAVYRRGDLRVAQANKRAADAAAAAIATEARERELEVEYGGPEGLKRKREEDAVVAKKKREDDVATAKKAASTATMTALMVDLFSKNVPCDGRGLPSHDSNMSKKQAKTTFKLTDTDLTKVSRSKAYTFLPKNEPFVNPLLHMSKLTHHMNAAHGQGTSRTINVPVARYNSYMGNSYAVYRRGDLRVAQANKRAADAAAAAIATEARERELEVEYGGPEGLKRKREEDAVVAKKKREDDVATAKKAASTATMTALMVDLFSKNVPCDGRGLPSHDSNMSKKQAKTTFKLTDTDLTKVSRSKAYTFLPKNEPFVNPLLHMSKLTHHMNAAHGQGTSRTIKIILRGCGFVQTSPPAPPPQPTKQTTTTITPFLNNNRDTNQPFSHY